MHIMKTNTRPQRGQSLVLIALMLSGLVAFVGLALDGGQAYAMRRKMQNAADAGALAGVAEVASSRQSTLVRYRVAQYAAGNSIVGNGSDANTLEAYYMPSGNVIPQSASMPATDKCIKVVAHKNFSTLIISFLGFRTLDASAPSTACFGAVGSVAGVVPWALNLDASTAPEGTLEALGSSVGSGGTYNYESIDTNRDGLGNYREAFCNGTSGAVQVFRLTPRVYDSITRPTFTQDEKDCLLFRLYSRPNETWNTFAPGSPRVLILPVMDGSAGNSTLKVLTFRAFFLESVDVVNSVAYGRFVHTVVQSASLDLSGTAHGVLTIALTQ